MTQRHSIAVIAASLVLMIGLYGQSSGQKTPKPDSSVQSDSALYVCPMHPKITASKPGECSKCGMDLVLNKKQPVKKKITQALSKQRPTKEALIAAGEYNCCVKNPCDVCFKEHGSCSCYKNAKTKKTVCEECGAAWKRGEGNVPGVNPDSIKGVPHKH